MKNVEVLSENNKMDRDKSLGEKEKAGSASRLWKPHKCINCNVCKLYTGQVRKGRAKKYLKEADQKKKLQLAKTMDMFLTIHTLHGISQMIMKLTPLKYLVNF